jgi:hypothetical protein
MRFEQSGGTYELIFVTDVINNGYGLEMSECSTQGEEVLVMTAFRPFGTHSIQISMHVQRLAYEVVKVFLDSVKVNLVDLIEPPDLEDDG